MKRQLSTLALLSVALLAATSCSHDTEPGAATPPDGRTALSVTSGIQTRAHDNVWDTGDAIGIYMLDESTAEAANKKYTTAAGGEDCTFAPATTDQTIYFPASGDARNFMAYYPHATIGTDNLYAVNVATQSSQKAIDLMAAAKVTGKSKTEPAVAFVFEHKLVKLDITLQGDGVSITNDQLLNTEVKITNQQTAGTYNVVDGGNVTPATAGASLSEITLLTTNLKAEGIVLPNTDTENMLLTFAVPALNNQTFEWAIKSAPQSQKFEAGKKYKYTITIAKAGLSVSSTVTDWLPGNGDNGESGDAE